MVRLSFLLTLFLLTLFPFRVPGQTETSLYQFSLQKTAKGEFHVYDAKYLSGLNPEGYTNQPWYTPKGNILVSVRQAGENQNDIWQLDVDAGRYRILTQTKDYEYSPRIHPDEERLTFVRKVGNEPLDQQIYSVDLRNGTLKNVTLDINDIGYYTWLGNDELGLFRIDNAGNKLSYYHTKDHKSRKLSSSIGRTLLSDNEGRIIYVHKFNNEYWYIKKYNPANSNIDIVVQTKGLNEDFAIGPDGTYFMANGSVLYYFNPARDKDWKQMSDLSAYGIKFISRIAVSPNGREMVLVDTKVKS